MGMYATSRKACYAAPKPKRPPLSHGGGGLEQFTKGLTMERIIEFSPAFDKRHKDPSKNYGIHGVEIRFVLKGQRGAVQFLVFSNWYLPNVVEEHKYDQFGRWQPMGADVGYHSKRPMYDEQHQYDCPYVEGGKCYYDGSGLAGEEMLRTLIAEGGDAVWKGLETYYTDVFGELE